MGEDMSILLELVLGKNVGGAPWSGAGGEEILGKSGDSANWFRGPMPLGSVLGTAGKECGHCSLTDVLTATRCYFTKAFLKPWAKY